MVFKISRNVFIIVLIVLIPSIVINIIVIEFLFQEFDQLDKIIVDKVFENNKIPKPPSIPSIYTKDMMSLSFDKHVEVKDDFDSWKQHVLSVLDLGSMDNVTVGTVYMINSTQMKNYAINKFIMDAMDGDVIIFYELYPSNPDFTLPIFKSPAVLILAGTGNQGAKDIINIPSDLSYRYYQDSIGVHIVNEGYVVYVIENRGWGERSIDVGDACRYFGRHTDVLCTGQVFQNALSSLGFTINDFYMSDTNQVLKYIYSLDYVDKKRVAIGGLSLGAGIAKYISIANPQINATFMASGTGNFHDTFFLGTSANLKYFDNYDLDALIVPRPLYISFGEQELGMFEFETRTNFTANFLTDVYEMFDAKENFYYTVHDGAHQFDIPSVLNFLNQTIGKNSYN